MKLEKKNLIVERPYKSVYKTEEGIVKIFATDHPKSAVFNEALNTVKVEETGLDIPKLKEVTQINVLKIAVDVGFVVGITAATRPTGSAIFLIPYALSSSITPHVLSFLYLL